MTGSPEIALQWPLPLGAAVAVAIALLAVAAGSYAVAPIRRTRRVMLAGLRCASLLLVLGMISGVQWVRYEQQLPDLVLMVDASASMSAPAADSPGGTSGSVPPSRWQQAVQILTADPARLRRLRQRYRVRLVPAGLPPGEATASASEVAARLDQLRPNGDSSRLGDALLDTVAVQRGHATAGIVLLSDGIVTAGASLSDAAAAAADHQIPIIAVALGSDAPPTDVAVDEALADETALLGDVVEVRALVATAGVRQPSIAVRLIDTQSGETLDEVSLPTEGTDHLVRPVRLTLQTRREGAMRLAVVADAVRGEHDIDNNRRQLTIDVRDDQLRVLLIQDRPSYEFRFLKQLLERATSQAGGENLVDLTVVLQSGDPQYADQDRSAQRLPPIGQQQLAALDVVILSDASVRALGPVFLDQLADVVQQQGVGLVVIAGPAHLPQALEGTALDPLLPLDPARVAPPEFPTAWPLRLQRTPLGQQEAALRLGAGSADALPPIYLVWRGQDLRPAARVLIEAVEAGGDFPRTWPLVLSRLVGAGQVWMQMTDESYRMEPYDGTGQMYERYWLQTIRQLARGKRRAGTAQADLQVDGERFVSGQGVPIRARVPAGGPAVTVALAGPAGDQRTVRLDRQEQNEYRGRVDGLPPGSYRAVLAETNLPGLPPSDTFVVQSAATEMTRLQTDVAALRQAAQISGGELLRAPDALAELERWLPEMAPQRVRPLPPRPLWNHPLAALLLLGSLCAEWILRRRWGLI